jgi:hypothetical protein
VAQLGVPFPATSSGTTISGYLGWQEAEYEVVAERPGGVGEVSNRVTVRFPTWTGPRLSFAFPTESNAGDHVPLGTIGLRWTYTASGALTGFRLFRRYYNDKDHTVGAWSAVGDIPAGQRTITLSGYSQTDRFDLYLQALDTPSAPSSNAVFIRFPSASNPDNNCDSPAANLYLPY